MQRIKQLLSPKIKIHNKNKETFYIDTHCQFCNDLLPIFSIVFISSHCNYCANKYRLYERYACCIHCFDTVCCSFCHRTIHE